MPIDEHRELARGLKVRFCLLVTSDAIFEGRRVDELTPLAKELVSSEGHELVKSVKAPNKPELIRELLKELLSSGECDVVVTTGGTGIGRRDVTVDVVNELCNKYLPGYGELFRYLTYLRHGTAAIASRATACVVGSKLVFTTPGSRDAFELAMKELILPEIKHLVMELRR